MDQLDVFSEKITLSGLQAGSSSEVISILGSLLVKEGYVKESFVQSTIDREKEFSTGLPLGKVNVALPHTDSHHVNQQGIAVGVLAEPVEFNVMGDPDTRIPVKIVFLLAIKESKEQVKVLQKVIDIIQKPSFIDKVILAPSATELTTLLNSEY